MCALAVKNSMTLKLLRSQYLLNRWSHNFFNGSFCRAYRDEDFGISYVHQAQHICLGIKRIPNLSKVAVRLAGEKLVPVTLFLSARSVYKQSFAGWEGGIFGWSTWSRCVFCSSVFLLINQHIITMMSAWRQDGANRRIPHNGNFFSLQHLFYTTIIYKR